MSTPLFLKPLASTDTALVLPASVKPLMNAATRGEDLGPVVESVINSLGFSSMLYVSNVTTTPQAEIRQYVYSTGAADLRRLPNGLSYVEVDPWLDHLTSSILPLVWDQARYQGRSAQLDERLKLMAAAGIASGVLCPLRNMKLTGRVGALSLTSAVAVHSEAREAMIHHALGDILLFGQFLHEMVLHTMATASQPNAGAQLSARELDCLRLVAAGHTSDEIADTMGLGLRTVEFHLANIRTKLGATTRAEAVAIAHGRGII